ncbi:hypothetical protein P43SY_004062 [Pythium insidiosum]|uniref:Zinc (Zn2)-Iron (Fe2) Permease (ZIP) Family n=1 Tax=Pythium insidiosum TaxID=114742 RepID=A0AAD5Q5C7_PYTIN|nr:hypothetical protein P43SY_004062 [Pythium insidiosum]
MATAPSFSATEELAVGAASITTFKFAVMVVVLVMTVISALLPLWISRNGTASSKRLLSKKLPFVTAGVFIGSGLLHLLPDAVKMYNKMLLLDPAVFSAQWMHEFPTVYLLSAVGCMIVWAVDLINLGDSGKMMAAATAARPNSKASYHKAAKTEETTLLLMQNGIKVVGETAVRTYSFDYPSLTTIEDGCSSEETDLTMQSETTVSEHVVFSGQSAVLPYLLAVLFSIHSLIAGFALGVNSTSSKTAVATTVAILSHKAIEAMSVGANFARAKDSIGPQRAIAVLLLYSLMTPLGIVLGMVLADALQGSTALLAESMALGVASGSFVYLAFHEMSEEHASNDVPSMEKILLFGAGLFSMAALATWT